ncbi:hypothetical protein I3843_11G160500 [Carya illinoinensis]|nr:hypothetical protein I3843_11G160500 [Carya illinoinensis]
MISTKMFYLKQPSMGVIIVEDWKIQPNRPWLDVGIMRSAAIPENCFSIASIWRRIASISTPIVLNWLSVFFICCSVAFFWALSPSCKSFMREFSAISTGQERGSGYHL